MIDNNNIIANNSLPYKTYCCKHFNIVNCINSYTNDNELQNIINYLSEIFSTPQLSITNPNPNPNPNPINNPNIYPNPANPTPEIKKEVVKQADFIKQNIKKEINNLESKVESKKDSKPQYEILGWKKVESRSRPGQFSYENIHTGERIQDVPKYEASKIPEKSKDLEEYE